MQPGAGRKVVCAMSGGVDSSVAAALLQEHGYEVVGAFMRLGDPAEPAVSVGEGVAGKTCRLPILPAQGQGRKGKQGCCSVDDAADARLVAAELGIPFYALNFRRDFGRIMDYFVAEYNAGRTPNPCVRCNDWLKFGKLHDFAASIGADFVASGHYARVDHSEPGRPHLLRGLDHAKDQSYVLFGATPERLAHMLLPIGGLEKPRVRAMAEERGLPVFSKPDSQEICFVPDQDYARFVRGRTPEAFAPGAVLDLSGRTVGEHPGHQHYTLGQRRGLPAMGTPVYVVAKDPQANTVTIGTKADLLAGGCSAAEANWIEPAGEHWRPCTAKVRYNSDPKPARVRATAADRIEVRFDQPLEAVTPGQAVVCYDGERVLCGGWIDGVKN